MSTAAVPKTTFASSAVLCFSGFPQMGSENKTTPNMSAIKALHFVQEYCRLRTILEQVAVVRILHWAKIVNIPAEMFRNDTKERMFMAP
mmetsp:Transcript_106364/g.159090  ORF Transcript_106364/g.159090 Transcript_106364/m.159090 type:complete len:89 (-) Transcript_106364:435-701(-)